MSAIIPPIPENPTAGVVDWSNVADNVREIDLEWLQNRSVIRFDNLTAVASYASNPDRVPGSLDEGQVLYLLGPNQLVVNIGSGVYRRALLTGQLDIAEADSVSTISVGGTGGISLSADGTVGILNSLKVGTGQVLASGSGLTIKIGSATALLTTDASDLVSSIPVKAPTLKSVGEVTGATLTISGAASVGALSAASVATAGAVTAGSITAPSAVIGTTTMINADGTVTPAVETDELVVSGVASVGLDLDVGGDVTVTGGVIGSGLAATTPASGAASLTLSNKMFRYSGSNDSLEHYNSTDGRWERVSRDRIRAISPLVGGISDVDARRAPFILQAGTDVITTGSLGEAWVNLGPGIGEAFPNGVLTVQVTNLNRAGELGDERSDLVVTVGEVELGRFQVIYATGSGIPYASKTLRVNFFALGW